MIRDEGKSAKDYLGGSALPLAEWDAAAENAKRLIFGLGVSGVVQVSHDLERLGGLFRRRGWNLARGLDHRWWPHDSTPDRSLLVSVVRGEDVLGVSAMRWIWLDTTLKQMHETGRFFYGDYAALVADRAECRVVAPSAETIGYCGVVYSCGWRQDGLKAGQAGLLIRLAQLLAGMNWHFSWMIGRSEPAIAHRWSESTFGFSICENGIYVARSNGTRESAYHLVGARIDWMRRNWQRAEYGTGGSLTDHLPLFGLPTSQ